MLGGFNYTFDAIVCVFYTFFYDNLTTVAEATKTSHWIVTYYKTYFTDVHLLVWYIV
jgi:hypothetical protein